MRVDSLAFRLVAGAALWSVAALAVGGFLLSSVFRDSVEEGFDARLRVLLEGLIVATDVNETGELELVRPLGESRFDQPYSGWYWQITDPMGELLRSRSLFDQALAELPLGEAVSTYDLQGPEGQRLRAAARQITMPGHDSPIRFSVAGDLSEVEREVASFNGTLIWSLSALGLGLVAAVLLQVRFGLLPLRRMRTALAQIRLGRADRLEGRFPSEVTPLAEELNALLEHNAAVLERARTHVGNLAHALKTPLSILSNATTNEKGPLSETVQRQTQRMRRQVDQYLARARAAATARVLGANTNVAEVVQDLTRALVRIHAERHVSIEQACPGDITFRGERQDLEEMVGNLLDNAFKWADGKIRVSAEKSDDRLWLYVDDDGPGLPESERERILRRGVRLDETVPGSGLGLSIVSDIADLYEGDIALETSPLGGLRAKLELPAITPKAG